MFPLSGNSDATQLLFNCWKVKLEVRPVSALLNIVTWILSTLPTASYLTTLNRYVATQPHSHTISYNPFSSKRNCTEIYLNEMDLEMSQEHAKFIRKLHMSAKVVRNEAIRKTVHN